MAFGPDGATIGEQLHGTGFRALAEKRASRCTMPDCQESESMLGRCLPRPAFEAALRSGLLRPSRAIDAGPLTLLITRLACWRTSLPYIAGRDGEQHFKLLSCPYWVHDAVTNLAHLVARYLRHEASLVASGQLGHPHPAKTVGSNAWPKLAGDSLQVVDRQPPRAWIARHLGFDLHRDLCGQIFLKQRIHRPVVRCSHACPEKSCGPFYALEQA